MIKTGKLIYSVNIREYYLFLWQVQILIHLQYVQSLLKSMHNKRCESGNGTQEDKYF